MDLDVNSLGSFGNPNRGQITFYLPLFLLPCMDFFLNPLGNFPMEFFNFTRMSFIHGKKDTGGNGGFCRTLFLTGLMRHAFNRSSDGRILSGIPTGHRESNASCISLPVLSEGLMA